LSVTVDESSFTFCGQQSIDITGTITDANEVYDSVSGLKVVDVVDNSVGGSLDSLPLGEFTTTLSDVQAPLEGESVNYWVLALAGDYYSTPKTNNAMITVTGKAHICTDGTTRCSSLLFQSCDYDGGTDGCCDWQTIETCTTSVMCSLPTCNEC
jgi:hypothetical protein